MTTLYVVGQMREGRQWELQGVFDTLEAADAACLDGNYFLGPVELNQRAPANSRAWVGCVYPRAEA